MGEVLSLTKQDVIKLEIERNQEALFLETTIVVEDNGKSYLLKLMRLSNIDVLTALFDAESIWITKTSDAQLDYRKYDCCHE